jgi:ribosome maturation factor RimP
MADRIKIEKLISEYVAGKGLFLVAVRISSSGRITVLVDRKDGITIEECADLSRFLEKNLDRNMEDFELQVSSPGLDMPFLVIEQYRKNEGKPVEVIGMDGQKYKGILKNVTDGGFEIETTNSEKKGSKIKPGEIKEISFNYEQVKSVKETVTYK